MINAGLSSSISSVTFFVLCHNTSTICCPACTHGHACIWHTGTVAADCSPPLPAPSPPCEVRREGDGLHTRIQCVCIRNSYGFHRLQTHVGQPILLQHSLGHSLPCWKSAAAPSVRMAPFVPRSHCVIHVTTYTFVVRRGEEWGDRERSSIRGGCSALPSVLAITCNACASSCCVPPQWLMIYLRHCQRRCVGIVRHCSPVFQDWGFVL